jgi:hypothetical protein
VEPKPKKGEAAASEWIKLNHIHLKFKRLYYTIHVGYP